MNDQQIQPVFFHAVVRERRYVHRCKPEFFDSPVLRKLLRLNQEFWERYEVQPTVDQLVHHLALQPQADPDLPEHLVRAAYQAQDTSLPPDWLRDNVETFLRYGTAKQGLKRQIDFLKSFPDITPENIEEVERGLQQLSRDMVAPSFTFEAGLDALDPQVYTTSYVKYFPTGLHDLDNMLGGGFAAKSLNLLVAQAKGGKSLWLGNLAAKGVSQGYNVAYVSLELSKEDILQRLGSNMYSVPMVGFFDYVKNFPDKFREKLNMYRSSSVVAPGQLIIEEFPMEQLSVYDLESWLVETERERNFKFDWVIVDYLTILKDARNPNSESTYLRGKNLSAGLHALAKKLDYVVLSAAQLNRAGTDAVDITRRDIAESQALLANCDTMLGIIQDVQLYNSSKYALKLLLNRRGGQVDHRKGYHFNKEFMRLIEDGEPIQNTAFGA